MSSDTHLPFLKTQEMGPRWWNPQSSLMTSLQDSCLEFPSGSSGSEMLVHGQLQRKEAGILCCPEAKGNDRHRAEKGLNMGSVYQLTTPWCIVTHQLGASPQTYTHIVTPSTGTISSQQSCKNLWFKIPVWEPTLPTGEFLGWSCKFQGWIWLLNNMSSCPSPPSAHCSSKQQGSWTTPERGCARAPYLCASWDPRRFLYLFLVLVNVYIIGISKLPPHKRGI